MTIQPRHMLSKSLRHLYTLGRQTPSSMEIGYRQLCLEEYVSSRLSSASCCIRTNLKLQAINIICYISLAIWDIREGWRWTCYILMGAGFGLSGLCMAYVAHFFTSPLVLSLIADSVGLMRSAPTTTKSEPLSWLV